MNRAGNTEDGPLKMEVKSRSDWYRRIEDETAQYRYSLGKKEAGKLKLDLLQRVAGRVDEFSDVCGECQNLKPEITRLVQELTLLVQMPDRGAVKNHARAVNGMADHLKKAHKLVDKGYYAAIGTGIGMAAGAGLGGVLGAMFDNAGIGTLVGIALGLLVGYYLDKKAEREGRVI